MVEDLRGSLHVESVGRFVVVDDFFQLSNDQLPLNFPFLEECFGLLKVGLLTFVNLFHGFQFLFCILEAFLELALGLIALTVLLFSFGQEFPHTTRNDKITGRCPWKVFLPGRSAESSSSPFGLFSGW